MSIFDLKIVAGHDSLLRTRVPVRKHKQRKSQSRAYHDRIQKKWTKRFGMKAVSVAYLLPQGFGLRGSPVLVMPRHVVQILNADSGREG